MSKQVKLIKKYKNFALSAILKNILNLYQETNLQNYFNIYLAVFCSNLADDTA